MSCRYKRGSKMTEKHITWGKHPIRVKSEDDDTSRTVGGRGHFPCVIWKFLTLVDSQAGRLTLADRQSLSDGDPKVRIWRNIVGPGIPTRFGPRPLGQRATAGGGRPSFRSGGASDASHDHCLFLGAKARKWTREPATSRAMPSTSLGSLGTWSAQVATIKLLRQIQVDRPMQPFSHHLEDLAICS
jgi:hypothetical protein